MSKFVAVRLDDHLLERVDRERRRRGVSRARAIHEALATWVAGEQLTDAIREEAEAYGKHPVTDAEFGAILGAQRWTK